MTTRSGKPSRRVLRLLWLGAACLAATGCSAAVEQKNSPDNAFSPNIRSAAMRRPAAELPEVGPAAERYSPAEYEKLGDIGFRRSDLEAAFINYEKALRLDPHNQAVRCKRAWVLVAGNFNTDAASEFGALLARQEHNAGAREGLGQAYFQMKRYDEAAEQFKKALAADATLWRSRNYLGIIYDHKKEPRRGIEEFLAAIAIKPDSGILHNNLGMAYSLAGIEEEALAAYRKALELGGPQEKVLNNIGLTLARLGKAEQARAAFMQAGGAERAARNMDRVLLSQSPAPAPEHEAP